MERTIQQFNSLELKDDSTSQKASGFSNNVPRYSEAEVYRMKMEFERVAKDLELSAREAIDAHRMLKKEHEAIRDELRHKTQVLERTTVQLTAAVAREEQQAREIQQLRQVNYALMVHLQQKSSEEYEGNIGSPLSPRPPPDVF